MGRKKFEPTEEQRRQVKAFSGFGVPAADIADYLHINKTTLYKYFKRELQEGHTEANAKVAGALFHMATKRFNAAAAIFWAKTRMGWREKDREEGGAEKPAEKPAQIYIKPWPKPQ